MPTPATTVRSSMFASAAAAAACIAVVVAAAVPAASAPTLFAQSAPPPHYHVAKHVPLGGVGGWDYLLFDTTGHRLFVARTDRITVVDPATFKVVGEIPGLVRGHGVALASSSHRGFTTSGTDSAVTMFDLETLAPIKKITVAVDDDAIAYDAATNRVFTFNGDANSASVIDPGKGVLLTNIPLGGKPEFGVSDGHGRLYVNIEDKNEVVQLDGRKMSVVRRWSIAPCDRPSGLAIDVAHQRLFSVCGNRTMAVSDAANGRLLTTVPICSGPDAARFDPGWRNAFASCGDGTITVVHEDSPDAYRVTQTIATMEGARTMALDPRTHRLYTVTSKFGPMPAAQPGQRRRRPPLVPGTFQLLVIEP